MLVNEKNQLELEEQLDGYSPLLVMMQVLPKYRNALLQAVINKQVFSKITLFSQEIGVQEFKKEHMVLTQVSSLTDVCSFVRGKRGFISSDRLLVLDIPMAEYEQSTLQCLLIALAEEIQTQKSGMRVLLCTQSSLPRVLSPWLNTIDLSIPRTEDNIGNLNAYVRSLLQEKFQYLNLEDVEDIAQALQGLAAYTIADIIAYVAYNKRKDIKEITTSNQILNDIRKERDNSLKNASGLEVIPTNASPDDLGGFNYLKRYLEYQSKILMQRKHARDAGVDIPKGFLLVGLPGCGKSLAAQAAALFMHLPLLRLDVGSLMGKYLGESEDNLHEALQVAEASAPCILWVDEIEKALGGLAGDSSGTGKRMLGRLLTWMQEQNNGVYMIATANDVDKLPPELMRRGRFDELFWVDLPKEEERQQIIRIHLRKRKEGSSLSDADISILAKEVTEGFTGADIEALIREGKTHSWVQNASSLQLQHLQNVAHNFTPLSKQFKDKIEPMRKKLKATGFRNVSITAKNLSLFLPPIPDIDAPLSKELMQILDTYQTLVFSIEDRPDYFLVVKGDAGIERRQFGFSDDVDVLELKYPCTVEKKGDNLLLRIESNETLMLARSIGNLFGSNPWMIAATSLEIIVDNDRLLLSHQNSAASKLHHRLLRVRRNVALHNSILPPVLMSWLWDLDIPRIISKDGRKYSLHMMQQGNSIPEVRLLCEGQRHTTYRLSIRGSSILLFAVKTIAIEDNLLALRLVEQNGILQKFFLDSAECAEELEIEGSDFEGWKSSIEIVEKEPMQKSLLQKLQWEIDAKRLDFKQRLLLQENKTLLPQVSKYLQVASQKYKVKEVLLILAQLNRTSLIQKDVSHLKYVARVLGITKVQKKTDLIKALCLDLSAFDIRQFSFVYQETTYECTLPLLSEDLAYLHWKSGTAIYASKQNTKSGQWKLTASSGRVLSDMTTIVISFVGKEYGVKVAESTVLPIKILAVFE